MGTTFRDQHHALRESNGQFAAETHPEPASATTALEHAILEAGTLRDETKPAGERFALLAGYLSKHEAQDAFSQDSLEETGPDGNEVLDAMAKDDTAVTKILEAAATELDLCSRENDSSAETAVAVADAVYEAWQEHNLESFFVRPTGGPRLSEQEIWDAYAEHPAKRNLLLVRNGFNPFPV